MKTLRHANVLSMVAVGLTLSACGGGNQSGGDSTPLTPKEALSALQKAGYECADPNLDNNSLGCTRPSGEAGWWTMDFVGAGHEYATLPDYVKGEWACDQDHQATYAVFGENWVVVNGGGSEDPYFTSELGGQTGDLGDICTGA